MSKSEFTVGQKVWFIGSVFYKGEGLVEGEIIKVGRKYIYVSKGKSSREVKFCKYTLYEATEIGTRARLYLSEQEYMDRMELNSNIHFIRDYFSSWKCDVSLEQTRKILAVLEGEKE